MARWSIVIRPSAEKEIDKLGKANRKRVLRYLYDRVAQLDRPRQLGGPLKGTMSEFWRYRIGDLRILCRIEDDRLIVLVIAVGSNRPLWATFFGVSFRVSLRRY